MYICLGLHMSTTAVYGTPMKYTSFRQPKQLQHPIPWPSARQSLNNGAWYNTMGLGSPSAHQARAGHQG